MVGHDNVCSLFAAQAMFEVEASSRVLQFASISFDASVFEMVMSLCRGASLHVMRPDLVLTGEELVRAVHERQVTHLTLPPSVLATIPEQADLSSVRTLIAAGEALSQSQARRWSVGRRLFNAYGPTETTVWASVYRCSADEEDVSIGRPISNTQIYILDERQQPVPIGATGEIYIGGAGVARGYWQRPQLTAQRFPRDPFSEDEQARVYRTGDLGRWRADGNIEYRGRNDSQVKLRGFRIELGEIESQLLRHARVKEAVVLAREDGADVAGEKRLVAYVTARDPERAAADPADLDKRSGLSAEALREHLQGMLPEHMVPSAFVVLESLPLTPNGKVDRRALPAPGQESYARREYEAPQGEIEVALAGIWQELLEVERVGRQDNFFDLGGHSLLATQVVEHIRRDLLVEVAVAELFERPVISSLSSHVDELRRNYFNDAITDGDTEELLRRVVEMSEDEAAILLREKATEEKS
jgi:acyl-coenzyme A synthetase/AMP-(fatty) acid ligase